jgi:hypothetical protein
MGSVKVSTFRFTDEELELLEMIQGHTGIRSRTEALRTVLQYYVQGEGLAAKPGASGAAPGGGKTEPSDK